jgi:hypothetical protein
MLELICYSCNKTNECILKEVMLDIDEIFTNHLFHSNMERNELTQKIIEYINKNWNY